MHEHKSAFPSNTLHLVQQLSNALLPIVLSLDPRSGGACKDKPHRRVVQEIPWKMARHEAAFNNHDAIMVIRLLAERQYVHNYCR